MEGKKSECLEQPGHVMLGYTTYSPEPADPAPLTLPFPWCFSLQLLTFMALTLPESCCGDKVFSL